jgi:acyl carrier protein phosphodiesterase
MNFLAHVFLSGNNTPLAIGNLIADRIKGNQVKELPSEIQKGVYLHREIDEFTDKHPIFKECVRELFPKYRHYSRVLVDMYFDHFLAANWQRYHPVPLAEFSEDFYDKLEVESTQFSDSIQKFIRALIQYNWFDEYRTLEGLRKILSQMERRTKFPSNLAAATEDLRQKYPYFEGRFFEFMIELISFTKNKLA